jgi:hypothetical protein
MLSRNSILAACGLAIVIGLPVPSKSGCSVGWCAEDENSRVGAFGWGIVGLIALAAIVVGGRYLGG